MIPSVGAPAVHIIVLGVLPVHIHIISEKIPIYIIFLFFLLLLNIIKKSRENAHCPHWFTEKFNVLVEETPYLRIFLQFQCLLIYIFTFIWDNDPRIYRARLFTRLYAEPHFRQNKEKAEGKTVCISFTWETWSHDRGTIAPPSPGRHGTILIFLQFLHSRVT